MRLVVELPEEVHRAVKTKAAQNGLTVAQVLRDAVDRFLADEEVVTAGATPPQPARGHPQVLGFSKADQLKKGRK